MPTHIERLEHDGERHAVEGLEHAPEQALRDGGAVLTERQFLQIIQLSPFLRDQKWENVRDHKYRTLKVW